MLQAINLECVRGRRRIFSGLSFEVQDGELFWVAGQNGSGKTSLLRIVCTLLRAESGEVRWRIRIFVHSATRFSQICFTSAMHQR